MSYTYLITGATSDVGRALIERLLQNAPADTLVLAQGCGDLEKLADLCTRFPGQVRPFDVDLSDRAKVDTFVQVLAASAPAPTHFIHLPALPVVNAKFKAFDQTRFDRDLEIQVHSAVRLCRAVLPAMAKARFGRVLFIQTSYTIGCPPKNTTAYVMAKSAIGGLVKSLAVEYARFGVTVNCVAPSMMETNFFIQFILLARSGLLKASTSCRWMYFMQIQYRPQEKIRTKFFLRFSQAFHQMTMKRNQMYLVYEQIG